MTRLILPLLLIFTTLAGYSQQREITDQKQIKQVLSTFMNCLKTKDSTTYFGLFNNGPISWVGVYRPFSIVKMHEKNSNQKSNYFVSNNREFIKWICASGDHEEKFKDIKITEDGSIASATFDYSFWSNGKMENYGSEHWGLVKANGNWKITSVIFSMEMSEFKPQLHN